LIETEVVTIKNDAVKAGWLLCPVCHNKTRIKLHKDTILTNLPLFCPKCKRETLVNVHHIRDQACSNSPETGMSDSGVKIDAVYSISAVHEERYQLFKNAF